MEENTEKDMENEEQPGGRNPGMGIGFLSAGVNTPAAHPSGALKSSPRSSSFFEALQLLQSGWCAGTQARYRTESSRGLTFTNQLVVIGCVFNTASLM